MNLNPNHLKYKNLKGKGYINLLDLLSIISAGVALGNAYTVAKIKKLDNIFMPVILIEGLLIGYICFWIIRKINGYLCKLVDIKKSSSNNIFLIQILLISIYSFTFIWVIASGVIGYQFTESVINILFKLRNP